MAAFDAMPPAIRRILTRAAYDSRAVQLAPTLQHVLLLHTEHEVAAYIGGVQHQVEQQTLARFAAQFRARHGTDLPHVAAAATIQR